ncbi:acid protease [Epithele typhae]|uniref:acid protease n=1 Tax=Epithele typhae TaxID=378194 RepID=UPI0020085E12|nr:acid protease [Epithele typhae]KAH9938982.1 acid protease [Epithele typhae]
MSGQTAFSSLFLSLYAASAFAFTPPARLDVPIVLSSGGRPMLGVNMGTQGVGQLQNFNFTLTTSLGYSAVASQGCSDCTGQATYSQSLSPDARSVSGSSSVAFGGGSFGGPIIKENCSLSTSSQAWQYPNQTIILMNNQSGLTPFDQTVSGLFGLGTLKQATTAAGFPASFDDSIYGQYYIRNPGATNFTFGMDLKPSPVVPGSGSSLSIQPGQESLAQEAANVGTMHWLQPDTSAYQADKLQTVSVQSGISGGYLPNSTQPDLTVQLGGWSEKAGSNNVGGGSGMLANIDPYYSGIYMPGSQARLFHDAISGSQSVPLSTILGSTSSWRVPCDTEVSFTVTINGQSFTIDQSALVVNMGNNQCMSIVEGFTDTSVTQYILGQTWIRSSTSSSYTSERQPLDRFCPSHRLIRPLARRRFYLIRRNRDNSLVARQAEIIEEHKNATTVEPYTYGTSSPYGAQSQYVVSPPTTPNPHAPLLDGDHLPPSYEEASEVGSSSAAATSPARQTFPREKGGYRRDTTMTSITEPITPNRLQFSASGVNNV